MIYFNSENRALPGMSERTSAKVYNALASALGSWALARYSGTGVPPLAAAVAAVALPWIKDSVAECFNPRDPKRNDKTRLFDAFLRFAVLTLLIKFGGEATYTAASKQAGKHLLLALGVQQLVGAMIRFGIRPPNGLAPTIV